MAVISYRPAVPLSRMMGRGSCRSHTTGVGAGSRSEKGHSSASYIIVWHVAHGATTLVHVCGAVFAGGQHKDTVCNILALSRRRIQQFEYDSR